MHSHKEQLDNLEKEYFENLKDINETINIIAEKHGIDFKNFDQDLREEIVGDSNGD